MKTIKYINSKIIFLLGLIVLTVGCERDLSDDAVEASFPKNGDIFIDGFTSGDLNYAPYLGSYLEAFTVDTETKYAGTAGMRFDVPNIGDPNGAFAGAAFFLNSPRDLSDFDALTFWAKGSEARTINDIGFGQDFDQNKFQAEVSGAMQLTTNWRKYSIPIPDPSKLTQERGMFWYAEGPNDDGTGWTFWIDELQFEKLGTIAQPRPAILDGNDVTEQSFVGAGLSVGGLTQTFNLSSGVDQTVKAAPSYFEFNSSNPDVATANELGEITITNPGTTVITASLGGIDAAGSLTLQSLGAFSSAPAPTTDPADVISIFSDVYTNVPVDFFNGFWAPYQTTGSADFAVNGDNVLNYTSFNFVGTSFSNPTVNASAMTHAHFDIFIPGTLDPGAQLKIIIRDFGNDGVDGGGDDTNLETTFNSSDMAEGSWSSLDIPLDIGVKNNLGLIIYENLGTNLTNFYADNIYFYKEAGGGPDEPTVAAPVPTQDSGSVISIYSDAYTNVEGTNLNPDWGQATVFSELPIAGNNTILYTGLNYQGIELGSSQDVSGMDFLHIDYWTTNSTALNGFLISNGGVETAKALEVPTSGWMSVDIALGDFSPVDLADVIQLKFDGNGDIYLDNIYFYTESIGGSEPTEAASTPTLPEANVISLFSDAYTDVPVDTWRTDWSAAATVFEDVMVAGEAAKKYTNLGFVGIETVANQVDASGMTHFHIDTWSSTYTSIAVKLVDFGPDGAFGGGDDSEHELAFPNPNMGEWVSFDIPLTDFTGLTASGNVAQFILVAEPFEATDVFIDNMYFHN